MPADQTEFEFVRLGALWKPDEQPDGSKPRYRLSGKTDRELGEGRGLHIPPGAALYIFPFARRDGTKTDRDPAFTISVKLPVGGAKPASGGFDDDEDDPFADEED